MVLTKCAFVATTAYAVTHSDMTGMTAGDHVMTLFTAEDLKQVPAARLNSAFLEVYGKLSKDFSESDYSSFLKELEQSLEEYKQSKAYRATQTCDAGASFSPASVKGISAFPGGIVARSLGFDLAKLVYEIASKAEGPAAASAGMIAPLAATALGQGAATIQALVHTALAVVPPMVPPPAWKNTPLTCMPMVSGHNCAGAVLYPITAADFAMADVTDASLDGVIANFPSLYKRKVGTTSDAAYRKCFNAYMGMHCGNLFPRCAVPEARQEPGPAGKLGLCFTSCIATLVACPGFWYDDIKEQCSNAVSVPPMCSMALFANSWRAPPQYSSYEEASSSAAMECPSTGDFGADTASGFEGAANAAAIA